MIKVYCYSKCSTCRKALKWLDENGIGHEVIDIKMDHPDEETLREYYTVSGLPLKRFFNKWYPVKPGGLLCVYE